MHLAPRASAVHASKFVPLDKVIMPLMPGTAT